jgi:hypothetical protein
MKVLKGHKLDAEDIYIVKKEPSFDDDGQRTCLFLFPPGSVKGHLKDRIKYAFKRDLPSPPFTLIKTEGHFTTKNADGLITKAEDLDTLAIMYKELAISDDNVNDICKTLWKGVGGCIVLLLLFVWLVGKDL